MGLLLSSSKSHQVKKKKVIMGQSDYLGQKFGQRGLALKKIEQSTWQIGKIAK
jgi:hypothetical protein